MNMPVSRRGLIARAATLAVALCAMPLCLPANAAWAHSTSIKVMHINDTHGTYKADAKSGAIGYSALSALASQEKPDIRLDAGDTFHGQAFATVTEGMSIAELLDALNFDATTPGNHDWNYGWQQLKNLDENMRTATLAANVVDESGKAVFDGSRVMYVPATLEDGTTTTIEVGVVGVIDESFYNSTAAKNVEGIAFTSAIEAANREAAALRKDGADVVIALTHNANPTAFAQATSGIDAVVAGHEHILIDTTVTSADGREVPIVEAGSHFKAAGFLTLSLSDDSGSWKVSSHTEDVKTYADTAGLSDPDVDAVASTWEQEVKRKTGENVGTSTTDYPYTWEDVRIKKTGIGDVVTSAYLKATGADFAAENAGGIRSGIAAGNITAGTLISISPYGNTLQTYAIKGSDVLTLLEDSLDLRMTCAAAHAEALAKGATQWDQEKYPATKNSGSVLAFGGLDLVIDSAAEKGSRIKSVKIGGAELDAGATYTMATNSFVPQLAQKGYASLVNIELDKDWGTCEQALRSFVGDNASWEKLVESLAGSEAAYVAPTPEPEPEPEPDPTPRPEPTPEPAPESKNADNTKSASLTKTGKGALPQTGDASTGATAGLALLGAGALAASRRRHRDDRAA